MASFRRSFALCGLVSLALARAATGPIPATLAWDDIQVVLFPDTADGTLVVLTQIYRGARPEHLVQFSAFFDPDSVSAWIPVARAFLGLELPAADTNRVALSIPLEGSGRETIFLARRKSDSGWTSDRYLGVRSRPGRAAQYINLPRRALDEFLDSLAAVVLRTPVFETPRRSSETAVPGASDSGDCPVPMPTNAPPHYPVDERDRGVEGSVWASFVVTAHGIVEDKTIQVIFATSPNFARAVRNAVPHFRFDPARRGGVAIPKRVVMPFVFQLMRPGEVWPAPSRDRPYERCS